MFFHVVTDTLRNSSREIESDNFVSQKGSVLIFNEPQLSLTFLCPFSSARLIPAYNGHLHAAHHALQEQCLKNFHQSVSLQNSHHLGHIASGYAMVLCRLGGTSFSICWWQGCLAATVDLRGLSGVKKWTERGARGILEAADGWWFIPFCTILIGICWDFMWL